MIPLAPNQVTRPRSFPCLSQLLNKQRNHSCREWKCIWRSQHKLTRPATVSVSSRSASEDARTPRSRMVYSAWRHSWRQFIQWSTVLVRSMRPTVQSGRCIHSNLLSTSSGSRYQCSIPPSATCSHFLDAADDQIFSPNPHACADGLQIRFTLPSLHLIDGSSSSSVPHVA